MIEIDLLNHLKANVPSVSQRVFANVFHQNTEKPALIYTVLSEQIAPSLGGGCTDKINHREWVIHSYAEGYAENKEIKNEVIAALKSFDPIVSGITVEDGFDEQSELFVQIITFQTGKRR